MKAIPAPRHDYISLSQSEQKLVRDSQRLGKRLKRRFPHQDVQRVGRKIG